MTAKMKRAEEWRVVKGAQDEIVISLGEDRTYLHVQQGDDIIYVEPDDVPAFIEALTAAREAA